MTYGRGDRFILGFDRALRSLLLPGMSSRPVPGSALREAPLKAHERKRSGALMRVNHSGEVCAQALYQGQALVCRDQRLIGALRQAAFEEQDHLAWTAQRLHELGARQSVLNPLWYCGALALGLLAGLAGDRWNLGFLAETERQVAAHLADHLLRLPECDARSRAILEQMQLDETAHAETARYLGGRELPFLARAAMRATARTMTGTAYRL